MAAISWCSWCKVSPQSTMASKETLQSIHSIYILSSAMAVPDWTCTSRVQRLTQSDVSSSPTLFHPFWPTTQRSAVALERPCSCSSSWQSINGLLYYKCCYCNDLCTTSLPIPARIPQNHPQICTTNAQVSANLPPDMVVFANVAAITQPIPRSILRTY